MNNTPWSHEEDRRLTKLWPDLTSREISEVMGRSRNAIIGRAHRLGLAVKKSKLGDGNRKKKEPSLPKRAAQRKLPRVIAPIPIIWDGSGVPFLDIKKGQCRAVMGSSNDSRGLAVFCGAPVEDGENFEFCKGHMALYTSPARR